MIRWIKAKIGLMIWHMVVVDASVDHLLEMAEMLTKKAHEKELEELEEMIKNETKND